MLHKSVLYHYNDHYYEAIDAEGVVALYRQYISPGLDGVKNLRNHLDIYKCMKSNPRLKYEDSLKDFLYALWMDDDRTLVDEFSTIIKDLVEYDFSIAEEQMNERLNIA